MHLAWIEGIGIIGIIVPGMTLEPLNRFLILGILGVFEDIHHAVIAWDTATVLWGTSTLTRNAAGVRYVFFLQ